MRTSEGNLLWECVNFNFEPGLIRNIGAPRGPKSLLERVIHL